MRAPRNSFVSKARQSTFVPKWGFLPRPSHPLLDGETPGPSQKTEIVTTKSVISVSPLPDSQVKIEWAEGAKTESVVAASCSISSQGDGLTITYKCPSNDTLSTTKANNLLRCIKLPKIAGDLSSVKSSSEPIIASTQPKGKQNCVQNSEVTLGDIQDVEIHEVVKICPNLNQKKSDSCPLKISSEEINKSSEDSHSQENSGKSDVNVKGSQDLAICEAVNRKTTSNTLSCVELNQTERVFIEKSASTEDTRQKVTSSEHSSCKDVDGKRKDGEVISSSHRSSLGAKLNQKLSSEETEPEKCLPETVDSTTNGAVAETTMNMAMKRSLSSPTEGPAKKLFKMAGRYSESYMGQVGSIPSTSRGSRMRDVNARTFKKASKRCVNLIPKEPVKNSTKDSRRSMTQACTRQKVTNNSETSEEELFATCSGNSSPYHSTCEEVDMEESGTTDITDLYRESDSERRESTISSSAPPTLDDITSTGMSSLQNTDDTETRDGPKIFPNRMTMKSYQNVSGKDVWELSLNFD